jgi:hypothetical protein
MTDPDRQRLVVLRVSDGTVRYFGGNGPRPELRLLSGIAVGAVGQIYALDRQLNTIHVISVSEIESLLASPPSR